MAHELDMALPEWVLSYLRKSADQLLEISDGLGDKTNAAVAEALNIKTSGRGTYFKRLKEDERNFKIYMLVHDERERTQPRVDTTINEMIGEEFGLKSSAVRKIVEQYSEFLKIKD